MKTITTFLLLFLSVSIFAQDVTFVHQATTDNIGIQGSILWATYIDHPELNNNPDAIAIVNGNLNPTGTDVFNSNSIGVYYEPFNSRWGIFNENFELMPENSSYSVYILNDGTGITHVSTSTNQGPAASITLIDHPLLNGNPEMQPLITKKWEESTQVYDTLNYGVYYDTDSSRWGIYNEEGGQDIPENSTFNIMVQPSSNATVYTHQVTAENANINATFLDHPLLNNNPNAVFVATHAWGVNGQNSQILADYTFTQWYNAGIGRWAILNNFAENEMEIGTTYHVAINDEVLSINDINSSIKLSAHPNPTIDITNITSTTEIQKITVHNILGQEVVSLDIDNLFDVQIDLSTQNTGTYIFSIKTVNGVQNLKIVKQ